jgi:hypothetical protein
MCGNVSKVKDISVHDREMPMNKHIIREKISFETIDRKISISNKFYPIYI